MVSSVFGIGSSGLFAAQAGLATAGHNIANVNTPGYSRQQVMQSSASGTFTGSGFFGQGVQVDTVRRAYSDSLTGELRNAQASASFQEARNASLVRVDGQFGDLSTSLSPSLEDFFAGVNAVAAQPADVASRQSMLSAAQALVTRFHQTGQQLSEVRDGVSRQIEASVQTINTYSTKFAELNYSIARSLGAGSGAQAPNDLLDQRDNLLLEMNRLIGATGVEQGDGTMNVFLANGQGVVIGEKAYSLDARVSMINSTDPTNLSVGLVTQGGFVAFRAADVRGGSLGGLLDFRDNELSYAENAVGRMALVLAENFNAQHRLGQDLNGNPGADFFKLPEIDAPQLKGTGGKLDITVASANALTTSDYTIDFNGTDFLVRRLPDGTPTTVPPGGTIDGLTIAVDPASDALSAGDRFLIQPTRSIASGIAVALSDPARIAAASPVRTAVSSANKGTGLIDGGSVTDPALLTGLDYIVKFKVAAGATTYDIYDAANPAVSLATGNYTPGAAITINPGMKVMVSGAPSSGDQFTVGPNTGGKGDNRNALALAALSSSSLVGGKSSFAGEYARIVATIGSAAHEADIESTTQGQILLQAQSAQASVSGVNLDEEAANLQRYQQAYQASGKLMAVAATLFQTILDIAR